MSFLNYSTELFHNGENAFYKTTVANVLKNTKTPLVQRNHEDRVLSGKVNYLYEPLPQHFVMAAAVYNGHPTLYKGTHKLNKGDVFLVDGNTRKFFWEAAIKAEHPTFKDFLNKNIIVTVKEFYTPESLNEWYETFDSSRQLKTSAHMMQSAAHLSNIEEYRVKNITHVTSKILRSVKKQKGETDVDFRSRKIKLFGVDHINSFYDNFEGVVGKTINKMTPLLTAYRCLREDTHPTTWGTIDSFFNEFMSGKIEKAFNEKGNKSITMYLNNLLMEKGVYSYLNPRNSGNRLDIVSAVVYYHAKEYLKGNHFVGGRAYFANSQVGQERALEYFTHNLCK